MFLLVASVVSALGISFVCSLLEATLLSLPASYVATLSERRPTAGAIWQRFRQNIEKPIAVILVVNTAAHTVGATIAGAQFELIFGNRGLLVFSVVFTYLMLQFTEILPKTLGVRYNRALSQVIARPLDSLTRLLSPVLWCIHFVNRPFERSGLDKQSPIEEIAALATAAQRSPQADRQQMRMILAASRLDELRVGHVMTPRTQVKCLRADQPIQQTLDAIRDCPYTRLPLYDKNIDDILGFVHVKDLFGELKLISGRLDIASVIMAQGRTLPESGILPGSGLHVIGSGTIDLRKICREVLFFPESTSIKKALSEFQKTRVHLAIIVDEYGATQGIVTLEDVLEEIVGDIEDEYDRPEAPQITPKEDGYRLNGEIAVRHLREFVDIPPEDLQGVYTLGGYIAKALGRVPEAGDVVRCGTQVFRVVSTDGRRVIAVDIEETRGEQGEGN